MANETTSHEQKGVLFLLYQNPPGDFPVTQWLRIHLPVQGTWVDPWFGKMPQLR